ncbi:MAG: TetR family transcriptional regulator [Enterococcus lacertideformus]|uniref:TetR family transcriptional regulator n=1 Tax=Enterococcus lacertideformus TaxID=2771493 RepID=A0A931AXR6_9ENTE|nr:TetR family transcriptional regulator [Enterococcus lacertideformus]
MSEIQQLLRFMRSGKRKQITLNEYEHLVHKSNWTNGHKAKLINQIQKSGVLRYERCKEGYIIRLIR